MWKITFLLLFIVGNWSPSETLPQGAPESVCDTMLPFHGGGIPPQSEPVPFTLEPTSLIVGNGQTIRIDIVSSPSGLAFGGFMLQARNRNPPYQVVGQFSEIPEGFVKLMNCGGPQSSITHSNTKPKQDFSVEWQAPLDFLGEVIFNATIAQKYDVFWVGIQSRPVEVSKRSTSVFGISTTRQPFIPTVPVYVPETEPTPKKDDPFYDGCGSTKTCFGFPDGCLNDQSCRAISAVTVKGDKYQFEMQSGFNQPAYIALGLSTDASMGDDSVIECVPQGGKIQLYSSYTSPRPNLGVSRDGVPQNIARLLSGSYINGTIYCLVERDSLSTVNGKTFDLVNNKYHLLLATGASVSPNRVDFHTIGYSASGSPINLAEVQNLAGSSNLLVRLHGAFMIVAWIGTTSLGILLARYFKQTWVGSQLCGKDQWFAWHRICMVLTWSLTMAAFVLIFVELGDWSAARNPHAILGVITTAICFFQPIGALFRPAPNSKNRPFFNWGHWFGGNVAHILAIVTIFFAVKLAKAQLPEWMDWILVAYVAFHVCMHLIFSIAGCASDRRSSQRVNSFPMSDMSPGRHNMKMDRKQDAPFGKVRKVLLGIYICILVLFVVALVVIVVTAPVELTFESLRSKVMDGK